MAGFGSLLPGAITGGILWTVLQVLGTYLIMAMQALQNQRRPEQHIEVTFHDREPGHDEPARTPRTPDEVSPPAKRRVRGRARGRVKAQVPEPRAEPVPGPEPASSDSALNGASSDSARPDEASSAGGRV